MGMFSKAKDVITRCPACNGSGQVPHYTQGANEITKGGRTVAKTTCTSMRSCPTCGGSGRSL